jgi:hypothetical protein
MAWVTGDFGVDELDARTGRVLRQVVLGPLSPLGVGLGGGAAWVASVGDAFRTGTVTRIGVATGRKRVAVRRSRLRSPATSAAPGGVSVTWLARPATSYMLRLDPRTLRVELRLALY